SGRWSAFLHRHSRGRSRGASVVPSLGAVMVTGRQAASLLSVVLPTREHARLVLRAGLAGAPLRTSAVLLYDADRVVALAQRPPVSAEEVVTACPSGLNVGRRSRGMRVEVTAPWEERAAQVSLRPAMPTMAATLLEAQVKVAHRLPWVATLCGYVVLCAEARGLRECEGEVTFDLA